MNKQSSLLDYFKQQEPHLFRFWTTLTNEQRQSLEHQLKLIDLATLEKQKQLIREPGCFINQSFEAFDDFAFSGNPYYRSLGQRLIEEGQLGCLLLAGGQGTRLQFPGPKGTYPISPIKNKSLFQLFAEKVKAASEKGGRLLNVAIMTSQDNDEETRAFFKQHHYFGLNSSQIFFFVQGFLPLLDRSGHMFLQTPWQIASGPDGNGKSLLHFVQSGILNQWLEKGVKYLQVLPIDNPLADPFDAELVGFHHEQEAEITLKCTEKSHPEEKVGVLVKDQNHCRVVEYSEISESEKNERRADGGLKHCCANLGLFCFSQSFLQRIVNQSSSLPLHTAWKSAIFLDENPIQSPLESMAWKFETFIFDWMAYTQKIKALIYPRGECFAPLKNLVGVDSPETVREALQKRDRKVIELITKQSAPPFPFELGAQFYYPTDALLRKWQGEKMTSSYIE